MVIKEVSEKEVIAFSRGVLGLGPSSGFLIDDAFVAGSLRRAAALFCPCSPSTLMDAIVDSLCFITNSEELESRGHFIVQQLVSRGDLLELNQVTIDDPLAKDTWIFPATPAFIVRPGGSVILIGVARDEAMPLPPSLHSRIEYEGIGRVLNPRVSENLPKILSGLGLLEISETVWLRAPKLQAAADLQNDMLRRLAEQPLSGVVPDLTILDASRNVDFYNGRWTTPKDQSGKFVARRPQAYGASLWGFANLSNGQLLQFLDFPVRGMKVRAPDVAWHLQMAVDHIRNQPQHYRRRSTAEGVCLDFFSPIPSWAQRRLDLIGRSALRERCLFSYWVPEHELALQEAFLQDHLWLARREDSH
jgi:hypothetical protein